MKRYLHIPGYFYAIQLFDCTTKKEARQQALDFLRVSRMPNGSFIYSSNN